MDSKVKLISYNDKQDSLGNQIKEPIEREIYAHKKSVSSNEFYQASVAGLKAEVVFAVWAHEYHDEKVLEYANRNYRIIRTYQKSDMIEIVCGGK